LITLVESAAIFQDALEAIAMIVRKMSPNAMIKLADASFAVQRPKDVHRIPVDIVIRSVAIQSGRTWMPLTILAVAKTSSARNLNSDFARQRCACLCAFRLLKYSRGEKKRIPGRRITLAINRRRQ
jgi:hypothetical protein